MLFNKAIEGYLLTIAGTHSSVTVEYYKRCLRRTVKYVGNIEIDQIATDTLKQFYLHLRQEGLSGSSVQVYWKVNRAFFHWCNSELNLPRPDVDIRAPKFQPKQIQPFT